MLHPVVSTADVFHQNRGIGPLQLLLWKDNFGWTTLKLSYSTMRKRITCYVRTWLFLYPRIHTGVGHTDNESAQHFWLGKTLTKCSCAPDRVLNLRSLDLRVKKSYSLLLLFIISSPTLYQLSHPITPTVLLYSTLQAVGTPSGVNWQHCLEILYYNSVNKANAVWMNTSAKDQLSL